MRYSVYLDIDGVLLANESHLANYAEEFIKYVVDNHDAYWLTTHCMEGDTTWACEYVGRLCSPETKEHLKLIKGTSWKIAKTEAIDFSKLFLVFEDDMYPEEKAALLEHDAIPNWIMVDLAKDENQLKKLVEDFPLPKQL